MPSTRRMSRGITSGIPSTPAVFRESRGRSVVIRRARIQCTRDRSTYGPRATLKRGRKQGLIMIRKLKSGQYRLYSRKVDAKTGRRRNLGTFSSRAAAEKHERAVQFFKRHG